MGRGDLVVWSDFSGYRGRTVDLPDGRTTTVYEHREVMAAKLGRALLPNEHVHHKDENRANNDPMETVLDNERRISVPRSLRPILGRYIGG